MSVYSGTIKVKIRIKMYIIHKNSCKNYIKN